MSLRLAAMSRRSMRLASETSSTAVSSGTLPISWKYMRTGSLLGDLHREVELGGSLVVAARLGLGGAAGASLSTISMPRSAKARSSSSSCSTVSSTSRSAAAMCGAVEVALLVALFDEPADLVAAQQREVGGGDVVFEEDSITRPLLPFVVSLGHGDGPCGCDERERRCGLDPPGRAACQVEGC